MKNSRYRGLFFLPLLLVISCDNPPSSSGSPAASTPPPPSFNYIALGDSLAAGVQDGTTNEHTQTHSYAALLAKQIATAYGTTLTMPLLSVDGERENPDKIPTLLGISGEDSASIYQERASGDALQTDSDLHDKTLAPIAFADQRGQATSQLEAALWLSQKWKGLDPSVPKIITLWLNNDVLGAVVQVGNENYTAVGIDSTMRAPENFRADLEQVFPVLAQTGAEVFIGNIPDITQIAYLIAPETLQHWTGKTVPSSSLPAGARMSLPAALHIFVDDLGGKDWQTSLNENLSDASVMTSQEMAQIQTRIDSLNQILADEVQKYHFHLVDLHQALHAPQTIEGTTYTSEWGAGGFFSLDGVHFSHSGHAVTANIFIHAINEALGAKIPEISIAQVRENDPYVDQDGDGFPKGPDYEPSSAIVKLLFQFRDADDSDPGIGIRGDPSSIQEAKALTSVP